MARGTTRTIRLPPRPARIQSCIFVDRNIDERVDGSVRMVTLRPARKSP
jgi:hypothetical protein